MISKKKKENIPHLIFMQKSSYYFMPSTQMSGVRKGVQLSDVIYWDGRRDGRQSRPWEAGRGRKRQMASGNNEHSTRPGDVYLHLI